MKVNIIKATHNYKIGEHEVTDERAQYLIRMGIAEEVIAVEEKMISPKKEIKVSPVVAANKSKKVKSK